MKSTNYLLGHEELKIVQSSHLFRFSIDSILLPNFVSLHKKNRLILDIGTGNAPIPLILSTKTNAKIIGVELQEEPYQLACESVKLNHLEHQIELVHQDIKEYAKKIETDTFDCIVSNPPYFELERTANKNSNETKTNARHESTLTLEDLLKVSKKLLKNNGVFALVHRPERFLEILELMKQNNIVPKKIQFVYPKRNKEASILLVEGRKNGNPGMKVLPPLYIHEMDGSYTQELKQYIERK